MKRTRLVLVALSMTVLATGCASDGGIADADRLALYQAHAGAPLRKINYNNRPLGWETIDDDHVLVTVTPRKAYLMTLSGPCMDYSDGKSTIVISSQAGQVSTGFDRVTIADPRMSCRIEEIREVDMAALRKTRNGAESGLAPNVAG